MKRSPAVFAFFAGAAVLAISTWAVAQNRNAEVPGPRPGYVQPDAFGTTNQLTELHASSWMAFDGNPTPGYFSQGYIMGQGGLGHCGVWTQLNLPLGATVHHVYFFAYDNEATVDWNFRIYGFESATYSPAPAYVTIGSAQTSGTPGFTYVFVDAGNTVIRAFADLNGNGTANEVAYAILADANPPSEFANLRFWGAEVNWSRTVSPAPASATFSDVPTGYWAFRYIEALYSSGITAGCGGGNYCPEAPITRAEMAVFLAGALGLHWSS